jgi:predicted ATPase
MTNSLDRSGAGRSFELRPPRHRLWSDRFIGRERQLERLAVGLQSAADGQPNALILSGTAGLGLTRLLAETRRRVSALAEPFATVHGVAGPATAGVPYAPVTSALEALLRPMPDETLVELVGLTGDAIAHLLPRLQPRLAALELLPARPRIVATEWREARTFEAVLGLLERLGQRQPVVLMLEDLHHADASTRGLVTFLARVSRGQRLMLVATYQPDRLVRSHPLKATLATLATTPSLSTSELAPFDRTELGQLIEVIEGGRASSTTLLLVSERSGGNPLIAEELLASRRELAGVSLAGTFERLVTARADLRSPECCRVLRLLSMVGSPVTMPMLLAMAAEFERRSPARPPRSASGARKGEGLDVDMEAGVAEAFEHGFLVEAAESQDLDPAAERRIVFRHELIAEAIAADLLPATRRRYHSALGATLADRPAPEPGAALVHHLAAYELEEAVEAALAAAAVAEAHEAGADALAHYERALTLYEVVRPVRTPGSCRRGGLRCR